AFYFIFGVNETVPLLMNFFFATLLLVFIFYILREYRFSLLLQTLIPVAFIFFIPVSYLVFGGLEHVLQILINLAYIYTAAKVIAEDAPSHEKPAKSMRNLLFLLAPLVTMVRYEGLFILFAVSLLLTARKKWTVSMINAAAGLLPLIIYGIISIARGWYFLPNSVLLKGTRPDITHIEKILEFLYAGLRQVIYNIHLLVLLIVILAFLWVSVKKYNRLWLLPNGVALIFMITLACQAFFSESGYYLNRYPWIRYDCYLAALGMLTVTFYAGYWLSRGETTKITGKTGKIIGGLLVFILLLPLVERGVRTDLKVAQASANIYGQQYQVGLFLEKYYPGQSVAVNDIGTACFLADIRCLDVWGLANKDTGDLILNKTYSAENMVRVAQKSGVRIAVVYDQFFRLVGINDDLPKSWIKVAQWRIPNNVVCVRDTVTFYALDESETPRLTQNLQHFMTELPPEVITAGVIFFTRS
ncbi:MAG TPA: hypothetical protein VK469_19345, partial [Candidatus Kapabacteria bacterium]|nr:hypothetical protein [Candidatus Kapabacteria bacterium]